MIGCIEYGSDNFMNQIADAETKDLATALPPRYRWLKRLGAGLGLV